jgi:hypothetical protein
MKIIIDIFAGIGALFVLFIVVMQVLFFFGKDEGWESDPRDMNVTEMKNTVIHARRDEQIRDMVMDEIKRIMLLYKNADFSLDEEIARHILKAVSNLFPENNNK